MANLFKEYTIFCICNGGRPYNLHTYNNLTEAKLKLYDIISLEKDRNRPYYVHNDFFKNEYPASIKCKIFCIKERQVSSWEIYSKENEEIFNSENNIIFLNEFIK